jgi:hypothetical protein
MTPDQTWLSKSMLTTSPPRSARQSSSRIVRASTRRFLRLGLGKFVPQVSDEIRMHIISQAVEAKPYAEYLKAKAAAEAAAAKDSAKKQPR